MFKKQIEELSEQIKAETVLSVKKELFVKKAELEAQQVEFEAAQAAKEAEIAAAVEAALADQKAQLEALAANDVEETVVEDVVLEDGVSVVSQADIENAITDIQETGSRVDERELQTVASLFDDARHGKRATIQLVASESAGFAAEKTERLKTQLVADCGIPFTIYDVPSCIGDATPVRDAVGVETVTRKEVTFRKGLTLPDAVVWDGADKTCDDLCDNQDEPAIRALDAIYKCVTVPLIDYSTDPELVEATYNTISGLMARRLEEYSKWLLASAGYNVTATAGSGGVPAGLLPAVSYTVAHAIDHYHANRRNDAGGLTLILPLELLNLLAADTVAQGNPEATLLTANNLVNFLGAQFPSIQAVVFSLDATAGPAGDPLNAPLAIAPYVAGLPAVGTLGAGVYGPKVFDIFVVPVADYSFPTLNIRSLASRETIIDSNTLKQNTLQIFTEQYTGLLDTGCGPLTRILLTADATGCRAGFTACP